MYSLAFGDAPYLLKFPLSLPHPQDLCIAFITYRLSSFEMHIKEENTFPESICLDFVLFQDSTFVWLLSPRNGIIISFFLGHLGFLKVTWNAIAKGV